MRKISIRELHEATGVIVRSVKEEEVVVTDQGHAIAIIKLLTQAELPGRSLPLNHWESQDRSIVESDSTASVYSDRDR